MPRIQMPDGSMRDNLSDLLALCPRYFMVPPNPAGDVNFAVCGQVNDIDQLDYLHSGIPNCKPGIWRAEHRDIEGTEYPDNTEAFLRWVGELDESTSLDFGASLEEWEAWEQKLKERFDAVQVMGKKGDDVIWKLEGSYYDDGGNLNVISMAYLTREAADAILDEDDFDDDTYDGYLERVTLNDAASDPAEIQRNQGFTWGGFHFNQDSIGGPPSIAIAEQDGQVVAIKLFSDDENEEVEREDGFVFDAQPGKIIF